jgi:flagellar biosynthesis protein
MTNKKSIPVAVALQYDGTSAPKVTAKGKGVIAEQIMRVAQENNIPLHEEKQLVSVLSEIELGAEIPEALYIAIAEIIAFAYQISGKKSPLE